MESKGSATDAVEENTCEIAWVGGDDRRRSKKTWPGASLKIAGSAIASTCRRRLQVVRGEMRERPHAGQEGGLVDEEEWRMIRCRAAHLRRRCDADEEEQPWHFALVERVVLGAGDQLRLLHLAGCGALERWQHPCRQRGIVGRHRRVPGDP